LVGGRAAIFQSRGDHPHPRFAKILDDRPHSEAAKVPRPTRWHRRLRRVHGERHVVRPHCNMKYNTQYITRNVQHAMCSDASGTCMSFPRYDGVLLHSFSLHFSMHGCVHACERACVRACACVRAYVCGLRG
jgi:hypothetical protein